MNYVSEWWLPNRPQELLARRQGDCDDKALLLISLLKSVGIHATEVLVQTRYTGQPSLLKSDKVAIPMFDHGIAYLPGKNGKPGMWLDATSPQSARRCLHGRARWPSSRRGRRRSSTRPHLPTITASTPSGR